MKGTRFNRIKLLSFSYFLLIISLFLYSYTQVDLGLTLTRISIWQTIQRSFQYIGYFNRPLSTDIYLALLLFLWIFYGVFLILAKKTQINLRHFWWVAGIIAGILLFSYNAFSYDLFNYMFDAKILTFYGLNPYQYKALDFPADPFLAFMHWTHRTYPYGPSWLALTIPLSFLGGQKFLLTLFLFKAITVAAFLGGVYFIGKIMTEINPSRKLLAMVFFAFNPLVIIEGLVSAHNEIVMMFFLLWSIFLLIRKKYLWAWILFFFSIGIKFATASLLPIFILVTFWEIKSKKISWNKIIAAGVILMALAMIPASSRTEMQPWYFLLVLPLVALLPGVKAIFWPGIVVSFGLLIHYVPFLYNGNWDPPIPTYKLWINTGLIVITAFYVLATLLVTRLVKAPKK